MRLSEAEEYFGLCIAKVFLVSEGDYNSKGSEGLAKGEKTDVSIICQSFVWPNNDLFP